MIVTVEIVICLAAIAGTLKWTAAEYNRFRKSRQIRQAMLVALASTLSGV